MKSILSEMASSSDATMMEAQGKAATSGIRPARAGVQPITDLASFLQLLPDFGENVAELSEAIAESRAVRRAAAEAQDC